MQEQEERRGGRPGPCFHSQEEPEPSWLYVQYPAAGIDHWQCSREHRGIWPRECGFEYPNAQRVLWAALQRLLPSSPFWRLQGSFQYTHAHMNQGQKSSKSVSVWCQWNQKPEFPVYQCFLVGPLRQLFVHGPLDQRPLSLEFFRLERVDRDRAHREDMLVRRPKLRSKQRLARWPQQNGSHVLPHILRQLQLELLLFRFWRLWLYCAVGCCVHLNTLQNH